MSECKASLCAVSFIKTTLSGPNIFLSTQVSNIICLCSSFNIKEQVLHPHKTAGKIRVTGTLIFKFLENKGEG
jgi:hypothetical protein